MYLLAIDTATNSGGVAVSRNHELIGISMFKVPLRYSDRLLPWIEFTLDQLELSTGSIDCFAVAVGPGSFTGLRIGIATVKALCQTTEKPCIGVSTLEALAWRFREVAPVLAPMIDARRQQIYGGFFEFDGSKLCRLQEERVLTPAEWLSGLPGEGGLFVGDAAQMYARTVSSLRPGARVLRSDNCILRELCELAATRLISGEIQSAEGLKANYLRPSDAELSGQEAVSP